jgi:hypothetical protein
MSWRVRLSTHGIKCRSCGNFTGREAMIFVEFVRRPNTSIRDQGRTLCPGCYAEHVARLEKELSDLKAGDKERGG